MGLLIIFLLNRKSEKIEIPTVHEIVKDSLIRDSIYIINDSIIKEIKYIQIKHDEEVSTIMSGNDSINYDFFSKYIDYYNNKRTVENN